MKIKVNTTKFKECLYFVSSVIKSSASRVEFLSVQFLFKGGVLYLYGSDGSHFCEAIYGKVGTPDYACSTEFELIDKALQHPDSEDIELNFAEKSIIVIDGTSRYRMGYTYRLPIVDGSNPRAYKRRIL